MIDLENEKIITFREAAKRLPRRRQGKPVHVSTIWRWVTTGCRGHLLETLTLPGGRVTSVEALQRFFDRLSRDGSEPAASTGRTPRARRMSKDRAARELDAAGI